MTYSLLMKFWHISKPNLARYWKSSVCAPRTRTGAKNYLICTSLFAHLMQTWLRSKKIRYFCGFSIRWDAFQKRAQYTQCWRCQRFGHSSFTCFAEFRCVACGLSHGVGDGKCTKKPDDALSCANCKGAHPANYGGCEAIKRYREKFTVKH